MLRDLDHEKSQQATLQEHSESLLKFLKPGVPFSLLHALNSPGLSGEKTRELLNAVQLFPNLLFYPLTHIAAACALNHALANLLRARELYSEDGDGRTPLFYALMEQNEDGVKLIAEHFRDH